MNGGATEQKSCQMKSIAINNMEWIESITKRKKKTQSELFMSAFCIMKPETTLSVLALYYICRTKVMK